jgi:ribosome-binding protein aMBF1 (putative translation factor)
VAHVAGSCFGFFAMPNVPSRKRDSASVDLLKRVGANVRMLRERRGLAQDDLAYMAGLATRHLQKIEAGQVNATLRTIARLAAALTIDAGALVTKTKDPEH